jgi:hypothetical protein
MSCFRAVAFVPAFLLSLALTAQQTSVIVSGRAYDRERPAERLFDLMIINLRTAQGTFGKADGGFSVTALPDDTLMIASTGYEFRKFTFRDSAAKPAYWLDVPLSRLKVELREVSVFSPRELNSIYKDIEKLGYRKSDFQLSGINVLESPITFLYQEFSQLQRLKRHNAERINEEKRRQLLKDLLVTYVSYDIIQLDNDEFDAFIDFCQVPESYLKAASQYDFCLYIKQKFLVYQSMKPTKK